MTNAKMPRKAWTKKKWQELGVMGRSHTHAWVSFVVGMNVSDLPKGHGIFGSPWMRANQTPDAGPLLHAQLLEKSVLSPTDGCAESWCQASIHSPYPFPTLGIGTQKPAPYSSCACVVG